MDTIFTLGDLHQFLQIKLLFFVYVSFLLYSVYKRVSYATFLIGTYGLCALGYLLLVKGLILPFWGLKGDEITIAAMFQSFAHGSLFRDFAYSQLPPFYPSLFFQIFGFFGRLFDLNGVQIMKLASIFGIATFSIITYSTQKLYWQNKKSDWNNPVIWFITSLMLPIITGWNEMIMKSYELFGSVGIILWSIFLIQDLLDHTLTKKKYLIYGLSGGVLFMLFYFWFFLAAIGISIFFLINREYRGVSKYIKLSIVAALVLVFGSPFWLPLSNSYKQFGSENWQLGFFIIDWIKTFAPMFVVSVQGVFLGIGLFALLYFKKDRIVQLCISFFIAGYVWQVMGITSLLLFFSPLQESKGLHFFSQVVLVFGAAFGIAYVWDIIKEKTEVSAQQVIGVFAGLLLAPQLLFGTFIDKDEVQQARVRGRTLRPGIEELVTYLKLVDIQNVTIQSSGIPELYAFLPVNNFLYFNQHNSHPAAGFSQKYEFLVDLTRQKDSKAVHDLLVSNPIDYFVFYKGVQDFYPMYFHLDAFPYKIEEKEILLSKELFVEPYFSTVYQNSYFIVIRPNYGN